MVWSQQNKTKQERVHEQVSCVSSGIILQNRRKTDFWPNFGPIQGQNQPQNMATLGPILYTLLKVVPAILKKNKFHVNSMETFRKTIW